MPFESTRKDALGTHLRRVLEENESQATTSTKFETMKAGEILEKFKRGSINLFPPYHRRFVVSKEKLTKIIRSVYLKLPCGQLVLNQVDNSDPEVADKTVINVIDGKQRMCAILLFMMGVFPVDFLDGQGLRMFCNPDSKDPVGFKIIRKDILKKDVTKNGQYASKAFLKKFFLEFATAIKSHEREVTRIKKDPEQKLGFFDAEDRYQFMQAVFATQTLVNYSPEAERLVGFVTSTSFSTCTPGEAFRLLPDRLSTTIQKPEISEPFEKIVKAARLPKDRCEDYYHLVRMVLLLIRRTTIKSSSKQYDLLSKMLEDHSEPLPTSSENALIGLLRAFADVLTAENSTLCVRWDIDECIVWLGVMHHLFWDDLRQLTAINEYVPAESLSVEMAEASLWYYRSFCGRIPKGEAKDGGATAVERQLNYLSDCNLTDEWSMAKDAYDLRNRCNVVLQALARDPTPSLQAARLQERGLELDDAASSRGVFWQMSEKAEEMELQGGIEMGMGEGMADGPAFKRARMDGDAQAPHPEMAFEGNQQLGDWS